MEEVLGFLNENRTGSCIICTSYYLEKSIIINSIHFLKNQ